ncbi:TIGR04283 family arsenosugar biosynthesis glycosyltransferase [Nonlabens ponticola]|uniref:Glycosyltransferase n=1 Tax=Nonlabens ponticola TaxID=2496866 RepID=A0A3S9MUH4_9FLAO|nr:TIGR04283 family arsenosugar biosynthesis glycosyltransferase [Nonlabens ponticola]AZQ42821.1 glycosyltransferase [Nonlabens ponticola]
MMSIVIPVLNEETGIYSLLKLLLRRAHDPQSLEFIVVDGRSVDDTLSEVKRFATDHSHQRIRVIESDKGRGLQMHNGALAAQYDTFYFLHADSHPPKNYDLYIHNAIKIGEPAGCFRMRFRSWHWWLVIIGWFTRFNWRASRGGDQSQYITRGLYEQLGGYNTDVPIYEDYLLIHELYDLEHFHVIPKWLTTSARRYTDVGVFKLQWFYLTIYWKKRRGASIDEIYEYYLKWCDVSKEKLEVAD